MAEYIEREEIMNRLFTEYATDSKADVFELIRSIPTVDVQPIRHGRWIDLDGRILCSCCGTGYDDEDEVKIKTYLFCPNCGADMRGDENG